MKLVKKQQVTQPVLDKRYLIPSILAMGFVPLIMHEHTYNTHLENEKWFAVGNYVANDIFLFWKQWTIIVIALVCLLLLLIRAKYYKEKLPWEKKAFIPLTIYSAFVLISACFADKPLFAFAGGYDMFQSSLCLLSYVVIFYYTFSCIKSTDHVLYLLRGAEWFILAELVICFSQAMGHDLIDTTVGKILVTNPSRWSNLDSLTLQKQMYGTLYHNDYVSSYVAMVVPILIALLIVEKQKWRKFLNLGMLGLIVLMQPAASSSERIAVAAGLAVGFLIICSRELTTFLSGIALFAVIIGCVLNCFYYLPYIDEKVKSSFMTTGYIDYEKIPIEKITTGSSKDGITVNMKNGRTVRFTFKINDNKLALNVWDGDGNPLQMNLVDENAQRYYFADQKYAKDMQFVMDTSHGLPFLDFIQSWKNYYFTDTNTESEKSDGYYFVSSAGRTEKLPQKKIEDAHIFRNGFLNGRGFIYNRSIPLLKNHLIVGAGADNFIMEFPQRDYLWDSYQNNGLNSLNVKPHCYYLQLWIQEGFIAFAAVLTFYVWFIVKGIKKYRKIGLHDKNGIIGLAVTVSAIGYLVAMFANDSFTTTAVVFWTLLGLGWGIYHLGNTEKVQGEQ